MRKMASANTAGRVSMTNLYQYQQEAVGQVLSALETNRRVLLQCPTGGGKTIMAMELARQLPAPMMFLAERREIIAQTRATFESNAMIADALTASSSTGRAVFDGFASDYVIASQRTAWSRAVKAKHNLGDFKTIIIDEAHHGRARTYEELLAKWPDAKHVLLTATPVRGDGKGLGNIADTMVQASDYGGNYTDLVERGTLVPCPAERVWSWPADLRGIRTQAGDYAMGGQKGAARVMDTPKLVGDIVKHWHALAEGRQTIVYATSVAHAEHIEAGLQETGVEARTVHAGTDKVERREYLDALSNGEVKVVCNFGVLTEGFDCPPVSCIVLARPTKQYGLYIQMVGRGLRASPGKDDLMVLDHAGIVPMHGLPGQDVEWVLSTTQDAVEKRGPKAVPCPDCAAILRQDGKCGQCGYAPTRAERVSTPFGMEYEADGVEEGVALVRFTDAREAKLKAIASDPRRAEFHRLAQVAKRKGFKPGWAAYKFKDRYGEWPPALWRLPSPLTCSPEQFLTAAQREAAQNGWKPGWAAAQFKEAYGRYPT